jgi:hypothetical protein
VGSGAAIWGSHRDPGTPQISRGEGSGVKGMGLVDSLGLGTIPRYEVQDTDLLVFVIV